MKKLKLLFTFLLAFVVVGTVSAATTTYSVKINNAPENHTYEAYQIFAGDLSNDKLTLSNIVWGNGVKSSFTSGKNANDYAKAITNANAKEKAIEIAGEMGANLATVAGTSVAGVDSETGEFDGTYTISGLAPGYYLIKDKDGTQAGVNEAYTEYIVKLVGDTTVTPKSDIPTADKKINETTPVTYSTKYAIGDNVPYVLTGTLPDNYASYTTYKYVFHDKLSTGLTLNANSIKVYVDGTEITTGFELVTSPTDGDTLDVVFADLKTVTGVTKDSVITVEYTAKVNSNAVRGIAGNPNTLIIEFSNNPYNTDTGKTPKVITKVFVFDLILNKTDDEGNALEGAEFTLTRTEDGRTWVISTGTEFKFEGLGEGTYTIEETKTPDGYNTITPFTFTITPKYDNNGELEDLEISETGYTFTITVAEETAELETDIPNTPGVVLPFTGGAGTIIFTVVGLAIMAIAAIGFFKKNEE